MIAIACDHTALRLKRALIAKLTAAGASFEDFGAFSSKSCDYPVFARAAAHAVVSGACERGILLCGTGVGMCIAANKIPGARCVVCSEPYSAKLAREHNNANLLALGARVVGEELAAMIASVFLAAEFLGGRHARRVDMYEAAREE
jgi:ribose 5-phosphate isomerase B